MCKVIKLQCYFVEEKGVGVEGIVEALNNLSEHGTYSTGVRMEEINNITEERLERSKINSQECTVDEADEAWKELMEECVE